MNDETLWVFPEEIKVPPTFQSTIGGHPLIAQTLFQRGYTSIESALAFLNPDHYQSASPFDLQDMDIACELLDSAIRNNQLILVWGDFDVDGQTATTILVEGLRSAGGRVKYHIPVRATESHGIKEEALKEELKSGFDLLLTCDTGISEYENIQLVRNLGIPVIVTDHHTLVEKLPPANAIINPQRLDSHHPLRTLPGAGAAYKLIEGLNSCMGIALSTDSLLELAALGIVADVADLIGDTRYLLQTGLIQLRRTQRLGLQMLYQNVGLNPTHLNEGHIGFQIAPRLNAVGRLGDANPMVEFLTTQDEARASALLYQIEAYNTKRRFDTRQVEQGAEQQLSSPNGDKYAPAIVLHHATWPAGVVGIVASRLVERYNKPVILLTGEDTLQGSARSIPELNITSAIAAQASLLNTFGGHPMAAGLSMPSENLAAFRRQFYATAEEQLKSLEIVKQFQVTTTITLDQITVDLVHQVNRLAPFGAGNPSLLFQISNLNLISETRVGTNQEHRQVVVGDRHANQLRLIWWNGGDQQLPEADFDLLCKFSLSDYKGEQQLSAEWIDYRYSETGLQTLANRYIEIIDQRAASNSLGLLKQLIQKTPGVNLWGEGNLPAGLPFKGRHQLKPNDHLVIWTAPPSQSVLRDTILHTKPKKITLFSEGSNLDDYPVFINRLGSIVKYALAHYNGKIDLVRAASSCASNIEAVTFGLHLWVAKGTFQVLFDEEYAQVTLTKAGANHTLIAQYEELLKTTLKESAAFRSYFKHNEINTFISQIVNK